MATLRGSIARLPRFPRGHTQNVGDVAEFLGLHRPVSFRDLTGRADRLPETVTLEADVVTGAALGGHIEFTMRRDGSYTFSGHMRATGFPSFAFNVVAIVRSAGGTVTLAAQKSGKVFGTDSFGDREFPWNDVGSDPEDIKRIRNSWPDLSGGTLTERHSSELAGTLDGTLHLLGDLVEFFVVAETLGVGLGVCVVVGDELNKAGATLPGLGGIAGITVAAGVVYIFGPSAIVAAVVAGVAVGAVVDAMVQLRRLTGPEMDFARQVFGNSLDFDQIRLTNLSGLGGRCFTAPTLGHVSLVNLGNALESPTTAVFPSYPKPGQLFIHELTHAWQIQHASLEDGFVPGVMCHGIVNQTLVSDPYKYGPPGPPWSSFGLEAQAAIVDDWFGGTFATGLEPSMSRDSRYFPYIANNILPGLS
jgi:hypothetical protein